MSVSIKSTKTDILEAYEALRKQIAERQGQVLPQAQRAEERVREDALRAKTASVTEESVESQVIDLRRRIHASFDATLEALRESAHVLAELREATAIERKHIEEVRNIRLADDALQILVAEYDEKRRALAAEVAAEKEAWGREEEKFEYERTIRRRKEEDAYGIESNRKRAEFEEELRKRRDEIEARDRELVDLRAKVAATAGDRDAAVSAAREELSERLTKEFDVQKQLLEQQWRAERAKLDASVASLQENTKANGREMQSLREALTESQRHAQQLAATVIESVSGAKYAARVQQQSQASAPAPAGMPTPQR